MIDIEARAERVRTIVAASHGRVIERIGDKIAFEVPADVAPGMPWGPSGINTGGQWVRQPIPVNAIRASEILIFVAAGDDRCRGEWP